MKTLFRLVAATVILVAVPLKAATPDQLSGFSETIRVGDLLFNALETDQQAGISPHPIALETETTPYIHGGEFQFQGRPLRVVVVSTGFVELMRRVAKARAYEGAERGYLENYLSLLATSDPAKGVPELPHKEDPKFHTDDLLNNQRSYFSQMVSMVVAIELSHQYLGHYTKYADKLAGNVPINTVMKKADWQKSVEAGTENSLNAGYGSESVRAFYNAIDRMKQRPAWTTYFLPEKENVTKLLAKLTKLEKNFFNLD